MLNCSYGRISTCPGAPSQTAENGTLKQDSPIHEPKQYFFKYGRLPHARENIWQNFSYWIADRKANWPPGRKTFDNPNPRAMSRCLIIRGLWTQKENWGRTQNPAPLGKEEKGKEENVRKRWGLERRRKWTNLHHQVVQVALVSENWSEVLT